jgi:hypothetical protein
MKDNGKIIKEMVKVFHIIRMVANMMVFGMIISIMDMVYNITQNQLNT